MAREKSAAPLALAGQTHMHTHAQCVCVCVSRVVVHMCVAGAQREGRCVCMLMMQTAAAPLR